MRPSQLTGLAELLASQPDIADSLAVVSGYGAVSWTDIRRRAAGVATRLSAAIEPGDRVAIFLDRGPDSLAALFGIYAAAGVAVVVNEQLRVLQIEYIVGHSDARVLLTTTDMLSRLPRALHLNASIVEVDTIPSGGRFELIRPANDLAHIVYTSGSTGRPKGVMLTHSAIRAGIEIVAEYLGLRASDRTAWLLPLSSVYGLNQVLCAVRSRSALVVERSVLPHQIVSSLRAHGVTVLAAVPPLWHQLLGVPDFERVPLTTLRVIQNAGGHLPVPLVRRLRASIPQARLFLQYGMTETFRSTFLPPEEVDAHPDSMGRAIAGVTIRVVRDDGTPCDTGEAGELVHVGPAIAEGYWKEPDETAYRFRRDPQAPLDQPQPRAVFSGDLVRREADGLLYWVGRRDGLIKRLGFRMSPDEIVEALHGSGLVTEAVVVPICDDEWGEAIAAWVVLASGCTVEALQRYCRTELPRHLQPRTINAVNHLPRLPSGKYDLAPLREATVASPRTRGTPRQSSGGHAS